MNMNFTYEQAKNLLEAFGGDEETIITVEEGTKEWHSGPGLYAIYEACPEEGALFLGKEG